MRALANVLVGLAIAACVAACAQREPQEHVAATGPADLFEALAPYCNQAFEGRIAVQEPALGDPAWQHTPVLTVRECSVATRALSLTLGDDRSRVWVLNKGNDGSLSLRHMRHGADGNPMPVTEFGGHQAPGGNGRHTRFPINDQSRKLFADNGLDGWDDAVWTLGTPSDGQFVYELTSSGLHLRLEFDLTGPVAAPPRPWVEAAVY